MSKDGPPANSFVEPRKKGWLTKQGGQGLAKNWRKRWFILDHHYIFYYTSEKDKKPVGVVCLADYKHCRRADSKEGGKKNKSTFILIKGEQADEMDYPVRNYLIYADSDEEMESWISAINEEIQPGSDGPRNHNVNVKIDDKALNELSTSVEEGPKLTHLTAARPKVKGRRPPRKYIPFHEDDSKEDSEPADADSKVSPAHISEPSPKTLSQSPNVPKKGQRPSVPLKPTKNRLSTTEKPENQSGPQSGPPDKPETQTGPPEKPETQSGPPEKPETQSGPPEKPETQSDTPEKPETPQSGTPEIQSAPSEKLETQSGPPEKPEIQSAPSEKLETQSGPPEKPETQSSLPEKPEIHSKVDTVTSPITSPDTVTKHISRSQSAEIKPSKTPPPKAAKPKRKSTDTPPSTVDVNILKVATETKEEPVSKDTTQPLKIVQEEEEIKSSETEIPKARLPSLVIKKPKPPPARPRNKTSINELNPPEPHKTITSTDTVTNNSANVDVSNKARPIPKPRTRTSSGNKVFSTSPNKENEVVAMTTEPHKDDVGKVEEMKKSEVKIEEVNSKPNNEEATKRDEGTPNIDESMAKIDEGVAKTDEGVAKIDEGVAKIDEGVAKTDKGIAKTDKGIAKTDKGVAKTDKGIAKTDKGIAKIDEGVAKTDEGVAKIDEGVAKTDKGVAKTDEGVAKTDEGVAKTDDGVTKSDEGVAKIDKDETCQSTVAVSNVKQIAYENVVLNFKKDGRLTLSAPQEYLPQKNDDITVTEQSVTEETVTIVTTLETTSPSMDLTSTQSVEVDASSAETEAQSSETCANELTTSVLTPPIATPPTEQLYDVPTTDQEDYNDVIVPTSPIVGVVDQTDDAYDVPTSFRVTPTTDLAECLYDVPKLTRTTPTTDDLYSIPKGTPSIEENNHKELSVDDKKSLTNGVSSDRCVSPCYSDINRPPPDRDAWGYAVVNKEKSTTKKTAEQQIDSHDWLAMHLQEDLTNIPENLQKAKEILRLAKVVKKEAEELREEAERELAIAKRERHDAELLKKNAAEILRMAKEKLHESRT